LVGEFDLEALPEVADVFSESLRDASSAVRIDLQGLAFLDSSGIRALFMALRESESVGKTLMIIPGPPKVQRVFEVAGLLDVLPFEDPAVS
jgi:anti-sigma B factor antagonist